jgi:hypothetical protein
MSEIKYRYTWDVTDILGVQYIRIKDTRNGETWLVLNEGNALQLLKRLNEVRNAEE